jgi:hypothetical protein
MLIIVIMLLIVMILWLIMRKNLIRVIIKVLEIDTLMINLNLILKNMLIKFILWFN